MAKHDEAGSGALRIWLGPLSVLLGGALAIFLLTFYVDATRHGDMSVFRLFFVHPNPDSAMQSISNAGEVVAAVLAIAITVVAIVVELAANRYTHRITELFVAAPINFAVMGFFVVTALQCLWVAMTFDHEQGGSGFVPSLSFATAMAMLAFCLLILLPYFAFVFSFLNPVNIVDRIRKHTMDVVRKRVTPERVHGVQLEAVRGVEQLADVALNAMENKDKGVSMASVDALSAMVLEFQTVRATLPESWYRVEGELAHNADFVSMSPGVLDDVTRRRIWFEMKVLRQYQTIYNEALNRMRDVNYIIAINTRRIAEAAIKERNRELLDLVLKFFNTYLRATVNARDVRTAYNVLNQYRLLGEAALDLEGGDRSIEIARYFKYYGLISFAAKLPFILETVAYDLCTLNEIAFDKKSPAMRELLKIFLEVDKESESEVQEQSLRGVRKAQVKLATYYLVHGDDKHARQVFEDMERERPERLASIRDELLGVESSEFWEISDRGVNFDYLPTERKHRLLEFFEWFGDRIGPPRSSRLPSGPPEPPTDAPRVAATGRADDLHEAPPVGRDPGSEDPDAEGEIRPPE